MLNITRTITDITAFGLVTEYLNELSYDMSSCASHSGSTDISRISADDILFFDIETTGLSPRDSYLYLIGCMCINEGQAELTQLFSQNMSEESMLITGFLRLLEAHPVLVHFNGSTFDVPFLRSKAAELGIPFPDEIRELDIYQCIKPLKKLLGLTSMRQKSLEALLGIERRDMYDGGELIDIYLKYIAHLSLDSIGAVPASDAGRISCAPPSHINRRITDSFSTASGLRLLGENSADELLEVMLLHNFEDVYNLTCITPLLTLTGLFHGGFRIVPDSTVINNDSLEISIAVNHAEAAGLILRLVLSDSSGRTHSAAQCGSGSEQPVDVSGFFRISCAGVNPFTVTLGKCAYGLKLTVPLSNCEMKLFLPDYKNYYYLPGEDYCVHKSLGSLLDRSVAVKCKAADCYSKKTGAFAPVAAKKGGNLNDFIHLYQNSYKDTARFALAEDLVSNAEALKEYVLLLLQALL